jgi:hypothetical protein
LLQRSKGDFVSLAAGDKQPAAEPVDHVFIGNLNCGSEVRALAKPMLSVSFEMTALACIGCCKNVLLLAAAGR